MDIKVELVGNEIVVTRPGSDFSARLLEGARRPGLVMTRSWIAPTIMTPTISEFRAEAFQAALVKAQELGWIV